MWERGHTFKLGFQGNVFSEKLAFQSKLGGGVDPVGLWVKGIPGGGKGQGQEGMLRGFLGERELEQSEQWGEPGS